MLQSLISQELTAVDSLILRPTLSSLSWARGWPSCHWMSVSSIVYNRWKAGIFWTIGRLPPRLRLRQAPLTESHRSASCAVSLLLLNYSCPTRTWLLLNLLLQLPLFQELALDNWQLFFFRRGQLFAALNWLRAWTVFMRRWWLVMKVVV